MTVSASSTQFVFIKNDRRPKTLAVSNSLTEWAAFLYVSPDGQHGAKPVAA